MARPSTRKARSAKLSVSLAADHEAWLRTRSRREGRPFSTVLGDVVEDARQLEARRAFMSWLEKGLARPISAEDLEAVAREWRRPRARRSA